MLCLNKKTVVEFKAVSELLLYRVQDYVQDFNCKAFEMHLTLKVLKFKIIIIYNLLVIVVIKLRVQSVNFFLLKITTSEE